MSDYDPRPGARRCSTCYGYVDRDGDGWREQPDGCPLVLEYATQPDQLSRQLDELWKKNMERIGMRIELQDRRKWPENLKAGRAGKLMMWGVGWTRRDARRRAASSALRYGPHKRPGQPCPLRPARVRRALRAHAAAARRARSAQALIADAQAADVAYMPYKAHVHRICTDMTHPWVVGYRRHAVLARLVAATSTSTPARRRASRMKSRTAMRSTAPLRSAAAGPHRRGRRAGGAGRGDARAAQGAALRLRRRRDRLRPGQDQRPVLAHRSRRTSSRRCYSYDYLARP